MPTITEKKQTAGLENLASKFIPRESLRRYGNAGTIKEAYLKAVNSQKKKNA